MRGATWNTNERRILSWSDDGTARLWDVAALLRADGDSAALATLQHDFSVRGATWNADERRILSWNWRTAKTHYANSDDLIARACRAASRNFSIEGEDRWRSYMGTLPYRRTCERLPLHRSYRADVAARLATGDLDEAAAIAEVARALGGDPYSNEAPPAEEVAEAEAIVYELIEANRAVDEE